MFSLRGLFFFVEREVGVYGLCRSPLHARTRLQPACLAKAWSMWSRKPMPVFTLMVWDLLDWLAWPSPVLRRASVSGGNAPPSRFSASWILVSFVSRASAAQRGFEVVVVELILCVVFNIVV